MILEQWFRYFGVHLSNVEKREPPRPRPRIESLSDLVFGLALSIDAISLVGNPPRTSLGIYEDVGTFAFSFFVLISMWLRYTRIMSVLPLERQRTMLANVLLLFCVSIEPFLFNLLQRPVVGDETTAFLGTASTLFAFDVAGMMLMLGLFCNEIATKDRKLVPKDLIGAFRTERNGWFIASVIFFLSTIPIFWSVYVNGIPVRYLIWALPLVLVWAERLYTYWKNRPSEKRELKTIDVINIQK